MVRRATREEVARFSPVASSLFEIESGSNFHAVGPLVRGDRAYGISQVMGNNVPSWTSKYYGRRLTPQQYLYNVDAQVAVTNGVMKSYMATAANKTDNFDVQIRRTAASWFGGLGAAHQYDNPSYTDGYTSMRTYTSKVLSDFKRKFPDIYLFQDLPTKWTAATSPFEDLANLRDKGKKDEDAQGEDQNQEQEEDRSVDPTPPPRSDSVFNAPGGTFVFEPDIFDRID